MQKTPACRNKIRGEPGIPSVSLWFPFPNFPKDIPSFGCEKLYEAEGNLATSQNQLMRCVDSDEKKSLNFYGGLIQEPSFKLVDPLTNQPINWMVAGDISSSKLGEVALVVPLGSHDFSYLKVWILPSSRLMNVPVCIFQVANQFSPKCKASQKIVESRHFSPKSKPTWLVNLPPRNSQPCSCKCLLTFGFP